MSRWAYVLMTRWGGNGTFKRWVLEEVSSLRVVFEGTLGTLSPLILLLFASWLLWGEHLSNASHCCIAPASHLAKQPWTKSSETMSQIRPFVSSHHWNRKMSNSDASPHCQSRMYLNLPKMTQKAEASCSASFPLQPPLPPLSQPSWFPKTYI